MTTFTPLDDSAGTNHRGAIVHRKRGQEPVGIVIDRSCRVYIANIPLSRIERDGVSALKGELEAYGPVESYRMFTDIAGRFTGAALCTYRNPADATMAVMSMNGQLIDDAVLSVTVARDHGVVMLRRSCNNSNINNTANDNVPLGKWGTMSASLLQAGEGGRRNRSNSYVGNSSLAESADNDDGKWRHDKYETHLGEAGKSDGQENVFNASFGSSPSTLRLRGRGGLRLSGARGGRGARCMTGAERVNMQFEQYVAERDRLLGTNVERSDGAHHHPCTATESSGGGNEQGTVVGDVFHDMTPARQHSDHREDTVRCDYQENLDADQAEAVPTSSSSQAPPSLMTNETHLHRAHADVQQQQQQQGMRDDVTLPCSSGASEQGTSDTM